MKHFYIATYLIMALLVAGGADIQIFTPNGTIWGYAYPNGDFILQGPGNESSTGRGEADPIAPYFHSPYPQQPQSSTSVYGYRDGDCYIILQPGKGSSFGYLTPE